MKSHNSYYLGVHGDVGVIRNFAIAVSLAILPSATEAQSTRDLPNSFEFAEAELGSFELKAKTEIERDFPLVWPGETHCVGDNGEISFLVDQRGGIRSITFQFTAEIDGETDHARLGDELWLHIDGKRLEYIRTASSGRRFSNVEYPPVQLPDIILPVWTGFTLVRYDSEDVFMPFGSVFEDIIRAQTMEWSFKKPDGNRNRSTAFTNPVGRRFPIDLTGLREAVHWCRRQVASEAALVLPAEYVVETIDAPAH